jgi:hypothetical protein
MRSLVLLGVAAFALGASPLMADEPQAPAAPTAAAPTSAPAASPTPAVTQPATTNATSQPATTNAAAAKKEEYKPPLGYKKEKRDGLTVYCRRDVEKGSRFTKKTCFTQEDLEFVIARNKAASDDLIRATRVCSNPGTCANP